MGLFAGPDYVVEVCNPGLLAIWGRTAEQALHRPLFEVLPEIRDQGFRERLDLNVLVATTKPQLVVNVTGCPRLTFVPRNLRSIEYNLLSNALKYRNPAREPVVHVRCNSTEGTTVLGIEDNGLGLNEGRQARLFGLFQRLHTHVEGSGVGLYTIKKIVESAGGTITVRSQPDVGTAFTVTLPVSA